MDFLYQTSISLKNEIHMAWSFANIKDVDTNGDFSVIVIGFIDFFSISPHIFPQLPRHNLHVSLLIH